MRHAFHAMNTVQAAMPEAKRSGTASRLPRTASSVATPTAASTISSAHVRSQRRSADAAARDPERSMRMAGLPRPKLSASLGQTLTQSMHFMHPTSTTMPKSRISSWTRTLLVQTAVQWPHWWQRSWSTTMRMGASSSSGAKNPP